jgi:hypothetical protein
MVWQMENNRGPLLLLTAAMRVTDVANLNKTWSTYDKKVQAL